MTPSRIRQCYSLPPPEVGHSKRHKQLLDSHEKGHSLFAAPGSQGPGLDPFWGCTLCCHQTTGSQSCAKLWLQTERRSRFSNTGKLGPSHSRITAWVDLCLRSGNRAKLGGFALCPLEICETFARNLSCENVMAFSSVNSG